MEIEKITKRPAGAFEGGSLVNFSGGALPERFNGADCKSADGVRSTVRPSESDTRRSSITITKPSFRFKNFYE